MNARRTVPLVVSLLIAVATAAACGGAAPPPSAPAAADSATPPPAADSAVAAAPSGTDSSGPGAGASPAAPSSPDTIESQRDPFMKGCLNKIAAPDYCACGFEQFSLLFSASDIAAGLKQDDPRFGKLQQRTLAQCGSKLPEETVKASFVTNCIKNEPKREAYCKCAWPALRESLDAVDFMGDFKGPRFDAAKKSMVGKCRGKYPAEVAKAEFMNACTAKATTDHCACFWKKLRAKYSTEQIAAGFADIAATPGVDACPP